MENTSRAGLLTGLPDLPRKVALVHARRIGDFVCATPAFAALRAALPEAEIALIGLPWVRPLVERSAHLDRFVAFPGYPGVAEQFFEARRAVEFFQQTQEERFDLAVQMHGSGVFSNPFTLLLGARCTVGFIRPGDGRGRLDAACVWDAEAHETDRMLSMVAFLGASASDRTLHFPLWEEDHQGAERLLAGLRRPIIGLHPWAREASKRWALERFVAVGRGLAGRLGGTVAVLGGPDEQQAAEVLAASIGPDCTSLAGKMSLPEAGAVIARLALLVTNDSGPAHIAYALGTPTVTIFGSTTPREWGPPALARHQVLTHPIDCWPCLHQRCPIGNLCLEGTDIDAVFHAALRALGLTEATGAVQGDLPSGSESCPAPPLMMAALPATIGGCREAPG